MEKKREEYSSIEEVNGWIAKTTEVDIIEELDINIVSRSWNIIFLIPTNHSRAVGNVTLKKRIIVFYAQNIGFTVATVLGIRDPR